LAGNAELLVDVISEEQYYRRLADLTNQLRSLGLVVAVMLGIGSIFGGMNTMYAAVARRSREVGVLRVLGFGRGSILTSFLLESMMLGALGGIAGFLLTLVVEAVTGLGSGVLTIYMLFFAFRLSVAAVISGLTVAIVIGALGGFLPALRATRIAVIESIREA
jgi:putative ABC transport system permease protein